MTAAAGPARDAMVPERTTPSSGRHGALQRAWRGVIVRPRGPAKRAARSVISGVNTGQTLECAAPQGDSTAPYFVADVCDIIE